MNKRFLVRALMSYSLLLLSVVANAENWLYTVRPGDTLWDLCQKYSHKTDCWTALGPYNKVDYPRELPTGYVISFPVSWLKETPKPVLVTYVNGEVLYQLNTQSELIPLPVSTRLSVGARIVVRKGSANLLFADQSSMLIEPMTEVTLDRVSTKDEKPFANTHLNLHTGSVKTRVIKREPASRFRITTPAAVAAVRGTDFRVTALMAEKAVMRAEVFTGLVDVAAEGETQSVPAGFGIQANEGEPPQPPRQLLPAPTVVMDAIYRLPLQVEWPALDGAVSYQLEVLHEKREDEQLLKQVVDSAQWQLAHFTAGCYRLRLRGIDDIGLQGNASVNPFCITDTLSVPDFDSTTGVTQPDLTTAIFSWSQVTGAVRYQVDIAEDQRFDTLLTTQEVTTTQLTYSLENYQPLFVRVKALGTQEQSSDYSNTLAWTPKSPDRLALSIILPAAFILSVILLLLLRRRWRKEHESLQK